MRYRRVLLSGIGYELPTQVVHSEDLEAELKPAYQRLGLVVGQLEQLTGVRERRFWLDGTNMGLQASIAARRALDAANLGPEDIDLLIYAGVCRDRIEPATATAVAARLGVRRATQVFDLSNACLGALNGAIIAANQIELEQIQTALVVCCESAGPIVRHAIRTLQQSPTTQAFRDHYPTLTGGSGAGALVLTGRGTGAATNKSAAKNSAWRLVGAFGRTAPQHHELCQWYPPAANDAIDFDRVGSLRTDAPSVLKHGLDLASSTWDGFLSTLAWDARPPTQLKTICHQVGSQHRHALLERLNLSPSKDFATYPFLGNMGSASVTVSAALAQERGCVVPGDHIALMGIGSGLSCLMLGLEWEMT